uniref:Uncharacterized protein n=1 Tax=Siphoviridae sp. ctnR613 TaxID=2827939 RepID=A0A8S5SNN0_9CAUD|nr:MAG TPA: hypothetical protein [Siphoviridae sp. ctnR613]
MMFCFVLTCCIGYNIIILPKNNFVNTFYNFFYKKNKKMYIFAKNVVFFIKNVVFIIDKFNFTCYNTINH